jgi:class 3 adenylate cyclase
MDDSRSELPRSVNEHTEVTAVPALILVLDVRAFSGLANPEQVSVRRLLYRLLEDAFTAGGARLAHCVHEDRGDGVLVVVPPTVPKTQVLGPVLTAFMRLVADAPAQPSGRGMEVRIAVHGGEVHQDARGFAGSDVILAFRLLDSAVLREALAESPARCVLMVSDSLYQGTVRHDYPGMGGRDFHPVEVAAKETVARAWLHVPGGRTPTATGHEPPHQASPSTSRPGMTVTSGRDINVDGGVIAGGNVIQTPRRRLWWRSQERSK